MRTILIGSALGLALFGSTALGASAEPLKIVFTHHSSASNTFWQAVKKGFDDACEKIGASCQMVFTQTDLPDPVAPAINRCGIRARSATTG